MEGLMPFIWLLIISWVVLNIILTVRLLRACDFIREIKDSVKHESQFDPGFLLSRNILGSDIRSNLLQQMWQNYINLRNSGNANANYSFYQNNITAALVQLRKVYTDFDLGELPPQFQSAESFIGYCRAIY